jgi:riboflavin kinase / FMN adenylyltransferase
VRTYTAKVVRGQGVGRKLGFPTANLKLPPRARPPRGVWEVRVCGASIGERTGACNVGRRPTLGGVRLVTEVHIPGIRKNLYGKTLVVSFVRKIRAEKKFPSLPALRAQIRRDVESLRGV